MPPLLKAALAAALLSALGAAQRTQSGQAAASATGALAAGRAQPAPQPGSVAIDLPGACPAGTLPDAKVCIPVPAANGGNSLALRRAAHREKSGQWRSYDQIPRRPDRPADYERYRYPVQPLPGQALVSSGYDLDKPDSEQRRGSELSAVGHGGVDLAQRRGAEVRLVPLEHQSGDAEVVFVGPLFGNTVVTRHTLREGGQQRDYIVLYGHLEGAAPGLRPGTLLPSSGLVGFVGDSDSPGDVHLHLEIRRVRDGIDVRGLGPGQLTHNAKTVATDPRNLLPLR
jgi:murein DD-endopeptidase MepM/ murein hydrolase activator NlpD